MSLMQVGNAMQDNGRKDFTLVINDFSTYTRFSDFKNKEAAALCRQWMGKKARLEEVLDALGKKRADFHNASRQQRQTVRQAVINLEQEYERLVIEVRELEKKVRNTELGN